MSTLTPLLATRTGVVRDVGLLLGRVVLGAVFVVHGYKKFDDGIGGVQGFFASLDIPLPEASAVAVASIEIGGGLLLIVGALTSLAGGLLSLAMLGAAYYAHRDAFFVTDGGYEFVLVLAAFAAVLALVGAGRFSVDERLAARSAS